VVAVASALISGGGLDGYLTAFKTAARFLYSR